MKEENYQVVFTEAKKAEVLKKPVPVPQANEVLIRNKRTLISIGTELSAFNAEYPAGSVWDQLFGIPYNPGYTGVGEIVQVGSDVDKKWLGKKVAHRGTHSMYTTQPVDNEHVYNIHRDIPDEEAAMFAIPRIVMNGVRRSGAKWGDAVVVYGVGLLGQFAVRFCRLLGAMPVFAVDPSDYRLGLLPDDDMIIKLNPSRDDIKAVIREKTAGRMADIVFEVTGNQYLIEGELSVLRDQGKMLLLSSPGGSVEFDFHDYCNRPSYTIIGCHNNSHPAYPTLDNPWTQERHVEFYFDLVWNKQIDISKMISKVVSFTEAPEIYSSLSRDRSKYMGIIFNWDNNK